MNRHEELKALGALYALDALEESDRRRFEAHLEEGCEACARDVAELREGVVTLAASAPAVSPPAALRDRVLEAVRVAPRPAAADRARPARAPRERDDRERRVVRFPVLATVGWAAAVVLAILGVSDQRELRDLRDRVTSARDRVAALERDLRDERAWQSALASPTARVARFQPTDAGSPSQTGWALYDPERNRAIFVIENLSLQPGHDFELWAIGPEGPRSLGVLRVEPDGRALVRLPRFPVATEVSAFAVSYEAEGGSPNPTAPAGPVVLLGSL